MADDESRLLDPAAPQAMSASRGRIIPKPHPGTLDVPSIIESFAFRMMYSVARDQYNATDLDSYQALAFAVRDRLMDRWFATQDTYYRQDVKRVYYLSLEFLLGRLLTNNAINLGAEGEYAEAMRELGFRLEQLAEKEPDAGLGNGGLGRLAACFLDSASTLAIPFYGYGIRYDFGIFRQKIVNGEQSEQPDNWLRYGNPWEVPRPDVLFPVKYYGRVEYYQDETGAQRIRWTDTQDVYAMAYDIAVPGYKNDTVNSLRLWSARSSREFDLERFNEGDYVASVHDKNSTENIARVLYPSDEKYAGRELRLKQQHFFVSATIQDVLRRFEKHHRMDWEHLPDKTAIQLNDTHPSIAVAELMRILVDEKLVDWERAWDICQRVFGYTNHTVLPEALEVWSVDMMRNLLPRHMQIIEEIDRRLRATVIAKYPGDHAKVQRMSIIDDASRNVRMAHLAIVGSHSVNGVAQLHTDILTERVFPDFAALFPGRFNNKTNGITPRRWLAEANPELSSLVTEAIGDGWQRDLDRLVELRRHLNDPAFLTRWMATRDQRKQILAAWLQRCHGVTVDPQSLFDVQIKRIHEYKRQLLNVLHVISLYHEVMDGADVAPRTFLFAGKAAPSYWIAKRIIRLMYEVGAMIEAEPRAAKLLKVVFVPNYDVSSAEVMFPATDLSEQISTAGMEASGTGNMKAIVNGGVIIGTLDGANVEIAAHVGRENMFIFGHGADEIAALRTAGYHPRPYLETNRELRRVIDSLVTGPIQSKTPGLFQPIHEILTTTDRYFHCADFGSYVEAQREASSAWADRLGWARRSLANVASSGFFSSDRTIAEYAREIWGAVAVPVRLD